MPSIKFILIIQTLLVGFIGTAIAQPNRTPQQALEKTLQIRQELKTELPPKKRISYHLQLVTLYSYTHRDIDSLLESALTIAEEHDFKFFIARTLKKRARHNLLLNANSELILTDIHRIENLSKEVRSELLPSWVDLLYAHYYIGTDELDKAYPYMQRYGEFESSHPQHDFGSYYILSGMFYHKKKQYTLAIAEYKKGIKKTKPGESFLYNNIARLYLDMENPDMALEYLDKSDKNTEWFGADIIKSESIVLRGDVYLYKKDTLSALKYYNEAEKLRKLPHLSKYYTSANKLVAIYESTEHEKVDTLLDDISSYEGTEAYPELLIQKGHRMADRGEITKAMKLCKEGLSHTKKSLDYTNASSACDCLIKTTKAQKNYARTTSYLEQKVKYQQMINDEKQIITKAKILAQYEADKEKEILERVHEKDQAILRERVWKFRLGAIFATLFLGLSLFTVFQLRKRNRKIKSQNEIISKALTDKDLLLREIHHRVKNNLQLISSLLTLQGRSIDDEMAIQAINDGRNRVRSMALIHQDLYNKENLTDIGVKTYLEKLCTELFDTYKIDKDRIQLHLAIDDIDIDIDTMIPLGLIINELITNTLKYAFPQDHKGNLNIDLYNEDEQLILKVEDDGIGYDPSTVRKDSFGATLISALSDQLEGEMTVYSVDGTCTKLVIAFDS